MKYPRIFGMGSTKLTSFLGTEGMWNESFSLTVTCRVLCKLESVFGKAETFARPGGWVEFAVHRVWGASRLGMQW